VRSSWCEVHHVNEWAATHCTDANIVTLDEEVLRTTSLAIAAIGDGE
jgi:hypothetical protein